MHSRYVSLFKLGSGSIQLHGGSAWKCLKLRRDMIYTFNVGTPTSSHERIRVCLQFASSSRRCQASNFPSVQRHVRITGNLKQREEERERERERERDGAAVCKCSRSDIGFRMACNERIFHVFDNIEVRAFGKACGLSPLLRRHVLLCQKGFRRAAVNSQDR